MHPLHHLWYAGFVAKEHVGHAHSGCLSRGPRGLLGFLVPLVTIDSSRWRALPSSLSFFVAGEGLRPP